MSKCLINSEDINRKVTEKNLNQRSVSKVFKQGETVNLGSFENEIINRNKISTIFFKDLELKEKYHEIPTELNRPQVKLLLHEIYFFDQLIKSKRLTHDSNFIILYIGCSPGYHLKYTFAILKNYTKLQWHLYDPVSLVDSVRNIVKNNSDRIRYFQREYANVDNVKYIDSDVIFISDIRTNSGVEPSTKDLIKDYDLQNAVIQQVKPKYSFLKWRCPFPDKDFVEFNFPNGLELLQFFSKSTSTELRLIASFPYSYRKITYEIAEDYESKMFYYNQYIRKKQDYKERKTQELFSTFEEEIKKNTIEIFEKLNQNDWFLSLISFK